MKKYALLLSLCIPFLHTQAQNWLTAGNAGTTTANYLGTSDAKPLIFKTNAKERGRILTNGSWQHGLAAANSATIDSLGKLSFAGKGSYYVGGNRYIFHYSADTVKGLYLSASANQYQFLNSAATPLFYVNGDNGNSGVLGTFKVGAYTLPKTDGTNGQVLTTNGASVVSWTTVSGGGSSSGWSLTGNTGTTPGTNFLGTTDAKALIFRTKNVERMRIGGLGAVGIGTTTPKGALNVVGTTPVSLTGAGYVQIGDSASANLGIDYNQIQARYNTYVSPLYINYNGGTVYFGNSTKSYYGTVSYGSSIGSYGYGKSYGMYAFSDSGYGVYGSSYYITGKGVYGYVSGGVGDAVHGEAVGNSDYGGYFSSVSSFGLYAGTSNTGSYAGYFGGNVYSTGIYQGSDQKLKQNINDVLDAMDIIAKLKPKTYNFRQDGNYKLMNLPQGLQYGLIAQDVEKVLPNLVKETKFDVDRASDHSDGKVPDPKNTTPQAKQAVTKTGEVIDYKALNYTELIPIMIKGMQEQQALIDKQQQQIDELKKMVQSLTNNAGDKTASSMSSVANTSGAYLQQNIPNPFGNTTTINYSLPSSYSSAKMVVMSKTGNVVKQMELSGRKGSVSIDASTLSAGAYQYALYVDGKLVDSKQMILAK